MAPRKKSARSSRIPIVRKEGHDIDVNPPKFDGKGIGDKCHSQREYSFALVNPNDFDADTKFYLQEVLQLYKRELPSMVYAANTGKQSTFMEKCVSNGKYCTLLVKSTSEVDTQLIIGAISYQIVPADTQYAEIPLAAVSSANQHKGFGQTLYMELRKRLLSVGIRTIFCWGDKESEGFWSKQGFMSIAEVDTKGKARRIPVRADIRRALCFPGGSTLMVSHIYHGISMCTADWPKSHSLVKPDAPSLYTIPERSDFANHGCMVSNAIDQQTFENLNFQPEECVAIGLLGGENKINGPQNQDTVHDCTRSVAVIENRRIASIAELSYTNGNLDEKQCPCSTQPTKRVWEASVSSLKSKKVKGVHLHSFHSDSNTNSVPKSNGCDSFSQACSLGNSKLDTSASGSPRNLSTSNYSQNFCKDFGSVNVGSEDLISEELLTSGKSCKIMLMNIADEAKKTQLMKVIEELGGSLTSDGSTSTHVITGKVRKTLNFCTALCSGAWIVSPSWLKESYREGRFVDELPYVLNDDDYTSKYRASIETAVLRAKAHPGTLFQGYDVCISAHVQPPLKTLSVIVKSAGGNVINGLGKVNEVSRTIFVASEEDVEEALVAVKEGILTFNSEWMMYCVMRQELDLEAPQFAESL